MPQLSGKVAVITGSSKGIGAAIAARLASDGASVVVNYSKEAEPADAPVQRIRSAGGIAIAVKANIADADGIRSLVDEAKKAFGFVNILVNNAGVYKFVPFEAITPEHIDKHFNLNVKAMLLTTQAAVAVFPPDGGVVINISSGVALTPAPASAVYSGTKAAVDVMTRVLAMELGPRKIRVVGVAPGVTSTEGLDAMEEMTDESTRYAISRTPLGRIGKPDDIAAAVAFMASNDAAWVTGETLQVGGGLKF